MKRIVLSFSPWRRGPRKQAEVDADALRLLFIVCLVELCLWTFIKPLGRPLTVVEIVRSRWATYGLWEAHERQAVQQSYPISSHFEVLPKGHPLASCCPKEDPGIDAICLCKPGGGDGAWDHLPARPWDMEPSHEVRSQEVDLEDDPTMWQDVLSQLESEILEPSEMLHLALDKFLKELETYCRAKVLSDIRNDFAEKRLDAILNYRRRIQFETGCNPEAYDVTRSQCGSKFNQVAKLTRSEWVKQQEEEKRQRQRQKQREMWQHEIMLEEEEEDEDEGIQNGVDANNQGDMPDYSEQELMSSQGTGATGTVRKRSRAANHHHRHLTSKALMGDMIVGLSGANKKAQEHMELSRMVEDSQSTLEQSRPMPLTENEIDAINNPDPKHIEQLTKKCVDKEGRERVESHRLAKERREKAAKEERIKKAEIARTKEMLQKLEETRNREGILNPRELELKFKAEMDKALKVLLSATKSQEDKAGLTKAASLKSKELNAMRSKCDGLQRAIESLQDELEAFGGQGGSAASQLEDMMQRTKAETEECHANLSFIEVYREKLETEAKRQASEAASLDRLAKLAKGQRAKAAKRNQLP